MARFTSYDFKFCPFCSRPLFRQRIIPTERRIPRDHTMCAHCDRCLTCEEMTSHGFRKSHNAAPESPTSA